LVNHLEPSKRRHSAKRQAEQNGLQAATIGFYKRPWPKALTLYALPL